MSYVKTTNSVHCKMIVASYIQSFLIYRIFACGQNTDCLCFVPPLQHYINNELSQNNNKIRLVDKMTCNYRNEEVFINLWEFNVFLRKSNSLKKTLLLLRYKIHYVQRWQLWVFPTAAFVCNIHFDHIN